MERRRALGKPRIGPLAWKGVCCQEQEVQPYLDADVTCNLTEGGREAMGLPSTPGVDAMGCLSAGQGVVGSRGMGSSAFSPGTKGKGQHSCSAG